MSAGGNNIFNAGSTAASNGSLTYTGGAGDDSLTFGDYMAYSNGSVSVDMALGGTNTLVTGTAAAISSGLIAYTGGSGEDSLTFGNRLAAVSGTATFDLGSDSAVDTVTFEGTVAASSGNVSISNFGLGDSVVLQIFSNTDDVDLTATGVSDTRVTGTNVNFVISGVTTGSFSLTTNTSGHLVITDTGSVIP